MSDCSSDATQSNDGTPGATNVVQPHDVSQPHDTSRPHDALLCFEYESCARARTIARSVSQEVGEIQGDRSAAIVERDEETVIIQVVADDLVALRAGCNTWGSLVEVAEQTTELVR